MNYDKKLIFKCLLGFVAMVLAMKYTKGAGFMAIFVVFLAGAVRRDALTLFYGIAITIAMLIGNGYLMPKSSVFAISQRASMLLLSLLLVGQCFGQRRVRVLSFFPMMFLYLGYMLAVSFAGWCPMISLMKLALFSSVFFAYFAVAVTVANSRQDLSAKVRSVFLTITIFFIIGSVLLIPFPGISQMTGAEYEAAIKSGANVTSLFKGMTFHSQALGPVVAAMGVTLFADFIFGIRKTDKLYLVLLCCVPLLLWKTSSRTAMGTFIVGVLFCTQMFMSARGIRSRWKSKVTGALMMIVIGLSFLVLIVPDVRERAGGFILKYSHGKEDVAAMKVENILVTRQGKWDAGIANWKKSPLVGNGFQVSENMVGMKVGPTTLSAPVEKSVWISAILEEGGVLGFGIFLVFAAGCFFTLKRAKSYVGLSAFLSLMVINMGEFTMFSMSGIGGFLWALVFIGVTLDIQRNKQHRNALPGQFMWR